MAVTGSTDLPISDRNHAWDASAAVASLRSHCLRDGNLDDACAGRGFFYRNPDARPHTITAFKLPFAEYRDGQLTAVWRGITAVAAVLNGSRGGVDVPAAEMAAIRTKIETYYAKARSAFKDPTITVPWGPHSHSSHASRSTLVASALSEVPAVPEMDPITSVPVSGVCCIEGELNSNGEGLFPGALQLEAGPWPLQWQYESSHGGLQVNGTVVVGRIDQVVRDGNKLIASGMVSTAIEEGRQVIARMGTPENPGILSGVSIVADMVGDVTYVMAAPTPMPVPTDDGDPGGPGDPESEGEDMGEAVASWARTARLRAMTLCDIPAYASAQLYLVGSDVGSDSMSPPVSVVASPRVSVNEIAEEGALVAAAAATVQILDPPPAWWFTEPTDLPQFGAIQLTASGRLFGYLAPAGVQHRGLSRRQYVPSRNVDYSRWQNRPRYVQDDTGAVFALATGPVTMGCGHFDPQDPRGAQISLDHYDNSCSVVASACVGENANGTWIAGALLPDVTQTQITRMLMCQLSGDWRAHREKPGMREMTAALVVPVPAFGMGEEELAGMARRSASVRMDNLGLVASAVPFQFVAALAESDAEPDAELAPGDDAAIQALLATIGRDRSTAARNLIERVRTDA